MTQMVFDRQRIVSVNMVCHLDHNFRIEVHHSSTNPKVWTVLYIDYDEAIGCQGEFATEEQVMLHMDNFVDMAKVAYNNKWAKYGDCPIVKVRNGQLRYIFSGDGR